MLLSEVLPLDPPGEPFDDPQLVQVAGRIMRARSSGAPVILMMGAHVIKTGLSRFVIDLMERRIVTHVAMNGAGPIHYFELALVGNLAASHPSPNRHDRHCHARTDFREHGSIKPLTANSGSPTATENRSTHLDLRSFRV